MTDRHPTAPRYSATAPGTRIGERMRDARYRAGLTQQQLADRSGVSRRCIAGVEAGDHIPHARTVVRLALGLGVRPADLAPPRSAIATRIAQIA